MARNQPSSVGFGVAAWEAIRSRANVWVVVALGVAVVAVGLIVEIADSVHEADRLVHADHQIVQYLIDHRTAWLTRVAKAVTDVASAYVLVPIMLAAVVALVRVGRGRAAVVIALSSLGTLVLVSSAKHFVHRARPPSVDHLVSAQGLAFPSGHSAQSVACYGALAWLVWELGWSRRVRVLALIAAALIAFLVGVSRVYLAVHWPSDVVSGWLLGAGWLAVLIGAYHAVRPDSQRVSRDG